VEWVERTSKAISEINHTELVPKALELLAKAAQS
jgi:hypothetical protein